MSDATSTRPVIGMCAAVERGRWGAWDEELADMLPHGYARAVQRAGGLALMIPPDPVLAGQPDEVLDMVDALVLAGGGDIDPAAYGEEMHPATVGTYPPRDEFELALARRALERDMPVLGICRGMQLLNVAAGGTLDQHLPDTLSSDGHRRTPGCFVDHDVQLEPGTLAARAAGAELHGVKSHHHQGVARVGDGLVVSGRSVQDGIVEAIESPACRFALGVLWHPEEDEASRVIGALVDEARSRRLAEAAP
jgi:putative glutamine amidotransferase